MESHTRFWTCALRDRSISGHRCEYAIQPGQACVDSDFTLLIAGQRTLQAMLAPTLAFSPEHGLRYSIAVDGQHARMVDALGQNSERDWGKAVSDGVHRVSTPLGKLEAGFHSLRICRVDAGLVLERIMIFEAQPSEYLGPPESAQAGAKTEIVR